MRYRTAILFVMVLAAAAAVRLSARGNVTAILNSKHDFRAVSRANVRSTSGRDACLFCHTPHMGGGDASNGNGAAATA